MVMFPCHTILSKTPPLASQYVYASVAQYYSLWFSYAGFYLAQK